MVKLYRTLMNADLRRILSEPREIEKAVQYPVEQFLDHVASRPTAGATLFEGDVPIAAGGITYYAPRRGFVWLIASRDLGPYALPVVKEVRRWMEIAKARGDELFTTLTPGQDVTARFAQWVGFEQHPGSPEHVVSYRK